MQKILVIEDSSTTRHLIIQSLADEYEVIEAHDGLSGTELAKETLPDLIVCDSERVVSQLDAIDIGVPVLLSSSGDDPRLVRWREPFPLDMAGGAPELATKIAAIEQEYAWTWPLPAVASACEQA